jgi:hypothetical protein
MNAASLGMSVPVASNSRCGAGLLAFCALLLMSIPCRADVPAVTHFRKDVQPILENYCYECHGDGAEKGKVAFDALKTDDAIAHNPDLWLRVLKNTRAGLMPPAKKDQPTADDRKTLERWIKYEAFGIDPADPDPGRTTIRRLNRTEYRNTIRDLMGIEFKAEEEFPSDDTGYGFDNIGEVLTVSPLLLEKYMQAADAIVQQAVPRVPRVIPERTFTGADFHADDKPAITAERLSFYTPADVSKTPKFDNPGSYKIAVGFTVTGAFDFDPGRCKLTMKVDGQQCASHEFGWGEDKKFQMVSDQTWEKGDHKLQFVLEPLVPESKKKNILELKINTVQITGPMEEKYWAPSRNYDRFFTRAQPPTDASERKAYAREIIQKFATRAFRRPVDDRTIDKLVAIAQHTYDFPGKRFEDGVAQAIMATLSSPRFLFRIEQARSGSSQNDKSAPVDEYTLATRLSYFLWSTMPDDELLRLAGAGELRKNIQAQVKRMLADPKAEALTQNFVGQWLQTRDVQNVPLAPRIILIRDGVELPVDRATLDRDIGQLRTAMRRETEMFFSYIVHEDRSVLDFLDSDYTFVNEKLARHYGIEGVKGTDMRRVELPKDSWRGGLLTQGNTLVVTSNPTRTSPVKRGLFILENMLGTPTPPPPAAVPQLEESEKNFTDRRPTLREVLAVHREKPLCASCHNRMDPLGLALENFNALGGYREKERRENTIDASGKLITGEEFHDVRELKTILKERHRLDFYRCLTEKLLTYALGRGPEYYDTETIDRIVDALDHNDGRFSALLNGIIESAPFQRRRMGPGQDEKPAAKPASGQRADAGQRGTETQP